MSHNQSSKTLKLHHHFIVLIHHSWYIHNIPKIANKLCFLGKVWTTITLQPMPQKVVSIHYSIQLCLKLIIKSISCFSSSRNNCFWMSKKAAFFQALYFHFGVKLQHSLLSNLNDEGVMWVVYMGTNDNKKQDVGG